MNHIPAAHFDTVVNAVHESYLRAARTAADSESPGDRAAYGRVAADRLAAFNSLMGNAPVEPRAIPGRTVPVPCYVSGPYRVPVTSRDQAALSAATRVER